MEFETWKKALIKEIEVAAEWRAERALIEPQDALIASSQQSLFDLASSLRAMPADHAALRTLFREEQELADLDRDAPGEAECRYREAKEDLLRVIGFEHEPFADPTKFLDVLRNRVDETISEFRLG